ncbi:hypothetical protein SNK03_006439 [Fusarium graminearum]
MPRVTHFDTDVGRLPNGMQRISYDDRTNMYTFRAADGTLWENVPAHPHIIVPPTRLHGGYPHVQQRLDVPLALPQKQDLDQQRLVHVPLLLAKSINRPHPTKNVGRLLLLDNLVLFRKRLQHA